MNFSAEDVSRPHTYAYENIYRELNSQNRDTVGAQEAAAFLKRSNLDINTLGQIWEVADYHKKGYLDKLGAFIAFKLVAACQQGHPPSIASLSLNLSPPSFASRSATPSIPSFGNLAISDNWAINAVEQTKYESIFDGLNPVNGKLSGDKVKPVLLNSGLPGPSLAKIWDLSDIDKDGQLDRIEMCVALHLVYRSLQGEAIPVVLPASLIHPSKKNFRKFSVGIPSAPKTQWGERRSRTGSVASLDINSAPSFQTSGTMRSQSVQPTSLTSPILSSNVPTGFSDNLPWPVHSSTYEPRFRQIDTDNDGLVSGNDVRNILFQSALPQATLAQLWALVDIKKSGMINLEQFALIMYLIDDCKKGRAVPSILPSNLVPPSFRVPVSVNFDKTLSSSYSNIIPSGNEELDKLQHEMQILIMERREAEQAIVQLEADITIKNSEIKNLQIEYNTLENTVTQLERQKAEAERRLETLDNQVSQLEQTGSSLKEKLIEEENRLESLRNENMRNKENIAKEVEELSQTRKNMEQLEMEKNGLNNALAQRNAVIENAAIQLTKLENDVASMEEELQKFNSENEKLKEFTTQLGQLIEKKDTDAIMNESGRWLQKFQNLLSAQGSTRYSAATQFSTIDPFHEDSHASVDPFGTDPFSATNSFATFSQPFESQRVDPFKNSSEVEKSAVSLKTPPPRPAPPKGRSVNADSDPFASTDPFSSTSVANQFADFANFDAFQS